MVVISHVAIYSIPGRMKSLLFTLGATGVNIFFVISGFLITLLLIDEQQRTKRIEYKRFYIRRTLRIFPAYYFLLCTYLILQGFHFIYLSPSSWLTSFTYTKYSNWETDWLTSHAWSLSIEEQFYLLWPWVFKLGPKYRQLISTTLIVLAPIFRAITASYPISWINDLTPFVRIDAIAVGCTFAINKTKILVLLQRRWTKTFIISLALLIIIALIQSRWVKMNYGSLWAAFGTPHGSVANLSIATVMMYSIFGPKKHWFQLLNSKVMVYIGILSYSIYLWQQFFISNLNYWITTFPQNLLFLFLTALFSHYIIEKPFLKKKEKYSNQTDEVRSE